MSQYISRKSDGGSNPATQILTPNKWVTIEVQNELNLVPSEDSKVGALWACYLNIETPKIGGANELVIKWVRRGEVIQDATGYETKALKKGGTTFIKDVWIFQAKKGQPVVLQVKANGKATLKTREVKLSIS